MHVRNRAASALRDRALPVTPCFLGYFRDCRGNSLEKTYQDSQQEGTGFYPSGYQSSRGSVIRVGRYKSCRYSQVSDKDMWEITFRRFGVAIFFNKPPQFVV